MKKRYMLLAMLLWGCAYDTEKSFNNSSAPLVINEVATNNCTGICDAYGKTSNWIELYNRSSEPVNLADYYLSDDFEKLEKWQLGERILAPGAYEVIHASGMDYRDTISAATRSEVKILWGGHWSDGELEGGKSWVEPFAFDKTLNGKNSEGNPAVSASLFYGDCLKELGWEGETQVDVELKVSNAGTGNYLSLDKYNQMELRGYFEKGKKFHISYLLDNWGKFTNEGVLIYSGLQESFIGTGEEDGVYRFRLNRSENDNLLDLKHLKGLRFSHTSLNDTLEFTLNNVYFSSTVGNFHTSFKLSSGGDELYLSTKGGEIIDSLLIPALTADCSYGRDTNSVLSVFTTTTPGGPNIAEGFEGSVAEAVHTTPGGFYNGSVTVHLSKEPGTKLFYTLDGSLPTENATEYTAPFVLTQTTVVRTVACRDGALASEITSETYFVDEPSAMPIVSITVDPEDMFDSISGIYMPGPNASPTPPHFGANYWDKDLMVDAHMEFYENKSVKAFSRPMGLKIHGGWSRGAAKKSLALMFKEQYGAGYLEYPVFPEYPEARRYKSLMLRMGGDHGNDVIVYDAFNSYLTKGRGIDYQKMRSVKLFINGRYWGLYNIREKLNEHYFTTNYGLEGDEVHLIKDGGIIQQGSVDEYIRMIDFIRFNDLSQTSNYTYVKNCMDVYNYMDYMATQLFIVNNDWPANNSKWWKSTHPGGKWRWILYDTDGAGLAEDDFVETNMIEYATNSDTSISYPNGADFTFLFRRLLTNEEFKEDFVNRTMTLLNTNFHPDSYKEKLNHLLSHIGDEYKRDFARWGNEPSSWEDKVQSMYIFSDRRPGLMRENFRKYFGLEEPVTVNFSTTKGEITVNGMSAGTVLNGLYYGRFPIRLSVTDTTGFKQWSDGETAVERTVLPTEGLTLSAQY